MRKLSLLRVPDIAKFLKEEDEDRVIHRVNELFEVEHKVSQKMLVLLGQF